MAKKAININKANANKNEFMFQNSLNSEIGINMLVNMGGRRLYILRIQS